LDPVARQHIRLARRLNKIRRNIPLRALPRLSSPPKWSAVFHAVSPTGAGDGGGQRGRCRVSDPGLRDRKIELQPIQQIHAFTIEVTDADRRSANGT
jgi:hypothetical protein